MFCILEKLPLDLKSEKVTQIIDMPTGEPIVYEPGGYKQQSLTLNIGIKDISPEHLININNWLSGYGRLIFSNDPDKHYLAVANNAMTGNRLIERFGKIPVQFTVMPFKRDNDDTFHEISLIQNPYGSWDGNTGGDNDHPAGTASAKPTIKVYGTGDLHLTHHKTGIDIDVVGVDTYCIIDLPSCKVYDKNNNVILDRVTGNIDDIINSPGDEGRITVSSWVTKVEVKFNRRWL